MNNEDQVKADDSSPVASPKSKSKRNIFYRLKHSSSSYLLEYILVLISLGYVFWVVGYVFYLINKAIVDGIQSDRLDILLFNVTIMIVMAPLAIVLIRRIENEELKHPARLDQTLRKILGVLVSLVSICSVIGIAFVSVSAILLEIYDKGGDDILPYIPAMLIEATLILVYAKYIGSRRSIADDKIRRAISKGFPWLALAAFIALMIAPAVITRTSTYRSARALGDARGIANAVGEYNKTNDSMPADIATMSDLDEGIKDRAAKDDYIYQEVPRYNVDTSTSPSYLSSYLSSAKYFKICVNLSADAKPLDTTGYHSSISPVELDGAQKYRSYDEYSKGQQCFGFRVIPPIRRD